MHITIENNRVIVHLDDSEVPAFQTMFDRIQEKISMTVEFREFPFGDVGISRKVLPLHLCRTIGEANLSANPFATMSLYPFWKYGFAFTGEDRLKIELGIDDPHKKGVAADEFGMGLTAWAMEEVFHCETWTDTDTLIKIGAVFPQGSRRPDFVCTFPDGTLGIFEAKGTTGTSANIRSALDSGKLQTSAITAPVPIKHRVVVGAVLGETYARAILLDPPPSTPNDGDPVGDGSPVPSVPEPVEGSTSSGTEDIRTNLTAEMVRSAARRMRTGMPLNETEFRGKRMKITLKRDEYRDAKHHGWLNIV